MSAHPAGYTREFFAGVQESSLRSAERLVPLLMQLVTAKSVLDVGCGTGVWLKVFSDLGASDIFGVDGHVDPSSVTLPSGCFETHDLNAAFDLRREFDLVLCLEVAEHLHPESADGFVGSLAKHGRVVVFSAAIPGQGGTHHVNEQWPAFWIEKFREHGLEVLDILRPMIWNDSEVSPWFRQNVMLFTDAPSRAELAGKSTGGDFGGAALVHPEIFRPVKSRLNSVERERWKLEGGLISREIGSSVPSGSRFLLIDDYHWPRHLFENYIDVPEVGDAFPDGGTDAVNLCRCGRSRSGAAYLAVVQPAFWWLELPAFQSFLNDSARLIWSSDYVKVFQFSTDGVL